MADPIYNFFRHNTNSHLVFVWASLLLPSFLPEPVKALAVPALGFVSMVLLSLMLWYRHCDPAVTKIPFGLIALAMFVSLNSGFAFARLAIHLGNEYWIGLCDDASAGNRASP